MSVSGQEVILALLFWGCQTGSLWNFFEFPEISQRFVNRGFKGYMVYGKAGSGNRLEGGSGRRSVRQSTRDNPPKHWILSDKLRIFRFDYFALNYKGINIYSQKNINLTASVSESVSKGKVYPFRWKTLDLHLWGFIGCDFGKDGSAYINHLACGTIGR